MLLPYDRKYVNISQSFAPIILQHDVKTALFLLPHVLLYVLLDGTKEDVEEVSRGIHDQPLAAG